jgi:hypothetical protein
VSINKIKIIQNINKNVLNKKWICMHPNCNSFAINSHLLQKNKIINSISENSHVIELVENDYFKIYNGENNLVFKLNSLNKVMSHPLFCNSHDTKIFRDIETGSIDFFNLNTQILFSYRSLCGELWKKQRNLEFYIRMNSSKSLLFEFSKNEKNQIQDLIYSHSLGIKDLTYYKNKLETKNENSPPFIFKTFKISKLDICGSGVFSPVSEKENIYQEDPFPIVFVNIIPSSDYTFVILGKSLDYSNLWIENYFKDWESSHKAKGKELISDLIASRMESWAISPILYNLWKSKKLKEIENYWNQNRYNMSAYQKFNVNLFNFD